MINTVTDAGPFSYCTAFQFPHTSITYLNDGDGHFHQLAYIIAGQADGEIRATPDSSILKKYTAEKAGNVVDMSPSQGRYHTTITGADGLGVIMFNPIPSTRKLTLDIIKDETRTVTATDQRITIVCIIGPITANDKELTNLQFAKILPGNTVKLVVPKNSVCALVSE